MSPEKGKNVFLKNTLKLKCMFLVPLYYFYTFNRYYLKPEWKRRENEYVSLFATAAVVITIKVTIQCLSV